LCFLVLWWRSQCALNLSKAAKITMEPEFIKMANA